MPAEAERELRVLILTPTGRDAALLSQMCAADGIDAQICASAETLAGEIGRGAGVTIIGEEALTDKAVTLLGACLRNQPPWSDLPVIVLTGGGVPNRASNHLAKSREPMGTLTLVERPIRRITLLSSVQSALRGRKRQYEIRNYVEARLQAEAELALLVEQRTAAVGLLSARLMRLQDDERRHIARELHDSLGQYLAALGMNLDRIAESETLNHDQLLEARQTLALCLKETRTLSHLLHPPLLDELGLESAVRWFVDGFSQRSRIKVNLKMGALERFNRVAEIMFFRVLQETLTNIHRHSGSDTVDISLGFEDRNIQLKVRDYGRGIPPTVLKTFRRSGAGSGIGMAGMHERVAELQGELEIHSDGSGTTICVSVPIAKAALGLEPAAESQRGALPAEPEL